MSVNITWIDHVHVFYRFTYFYHSFRHSYSTYPGYNAPIHIFFAYDLVLVEGSREKINGKLELWKKNPGIT